MAVRALSARTSGFNRAFTDKARRRSTQRTTGAFSGPSIDRLPSIGWVLANLGYVARSSVPDAFFTYARGLTPGAPFRGRSGASSCPGASSGEAAPRLRNRHLAATAYRAVLSAAY